jgi:hypothetical protein
MDNVIVKPKKFETIYGLINRFNRIVDEESILKDFKLSKMRKKDKKVFKKFTAERRREKQQKRVQSAMNS